MTVRNLMVVATAISTFAKSSAAPVNGNAVYPNIAETSHASRHAVDFFRGYFTAKTTGNNDAFLKFWNPYQTEYLDSTLGFTIAANRSQLEQDFLPNNSTSTNAGKSYPLRILGDTTGGAIVYFVDTPELFGAEIRAMASFDFLNGTIRRQLDNWDGRVNNAKSLFASDPEYPYTLGLTGIQEKAAPKMQSVANRLNDALSAGNATAAAGLFSFDAVFEDLTLRARVEGVLNIEAYLQRTLDKLPYGPGASVTHVLGSAVGGGYEWRPSGSGVLYGITGLELDRCGNITRFTTVWDGSRIDQASIQQLGELAPSP